MKRMPQGISFAAALLANLTCQAAGAGDNSASSDTPNFDALRNGIALVNVKGIDIQNGNSQAEHTGTGFFINAEGYLVTAYHLGPDLGPGVAQASITYQVKVDSSETLLDAISIYGDPVADLRVLYVPLQNRTINTFRVATRTQAHLAQGKPILYTAGYPGGYGYSVDHGDIRSFYGPLSPTVLRWSLNLSIVDGQSGSPVFLSNGVVVAVAVSSDRDHPSIGFVTPVSLIPSQYFEGKFVYDTDAPTLLLSSTSAGSSTLVSEITVGKGVKIPLPTGVTSFDNVTAEVRNVAGDRSPIPFDQKGKTISTPADELFDRANRSIIANFNQRPEFKCPHPPCAEG